MLIECYDKDTLLKYFINVNKIILCGNNIGNMQYPSWVLISYGDRTGSYLSTLKLEDLVAEINALLGKDLC